ncbi:hypothetical protein AURDEDRAFT_173130 [Auricularia subglabra TFB-10046 SS5]|nr:hypothetical protein AURDEDRAFT_173130 [Auricularia subglabra TFB-10046 SS5]
MSFDYNAFAATLGRALSSMPSPPRLRAGTKNYVAAPDAFDGMRAHYETFHRSIELFLTQGDADAWAQNWVQAHDIDKTPVTWDRFLKDLNEQFLDPRIAENARESLAKLTQGRDPTDTFLKFEELRTKAGFVIPEHHNIVLVDYLRRNMRASTVLAVMSSYESKHALTDGVSDAYHEAGVINQAAYDKLVARHRAGISYKEFRTFALNQDAIIHHHGNASPTHHSLPPPPRRKNGQFFHKDLGVRYKTNSMFARPIGVSPCPPPVFPFPPLVQALLPMAAAAYFLGSCPGPFV